MAKSTIELKHFHGGINSSSDPRDIAVSESPLLTDAAISAVGKLTLIGSSSSGVSWTEDDTCQNNSIPSGGAWARLDASSHIKQDYYTGLWISITAGANSGQEREIMQYDPSGTTSNALYGNNIALVSPIFPLGLDTDNTSDYTIYCKTDALDTTKHKGLFSMKSDRQFDDGENDETLLFLYDNDQHIHGYDSEGWHANRIDMGTTGIDPCFYSADGVLRVSDANFNAASQWFGYIEEHRFNTLNTSSNDDTSPTPLWFSGSQEIVGSDNEGTSDPGICLISTPFVGTNTCVASQGGLSDAGPNSADSEYIGNLQGITCSINNDLTANNGTCNLRVGIQHNNLIGDGQSGNWSHTNYEGGGNTDFGKSQEYSFPQPIFGNINVALSGAGGKTPPSYDVFWWTGDTFRQDGSQSIIVPIFIEAADLALVDDAIEFDAYQLDSAGYGSMTLEGVRKWVFASSEMTPDCWNIFVLSDSNYNYNGEGDTSWDAERVADSLAVRLMCSGTTSPSLFLGGVAEISVDENIDGWQEGVYTFHNTLIYDGNQESLPTLMDGDETNTKNRNKLAIIGGPLLLEFQAYIDSLDMAGLPTVNTYCFNKRVTGCRYYFKEESNDNYFLIGEVDFIEKGWRWTPDTDTISYDLTDCASAVTLAPPNVPTNITNSIVKGITPRGANFVDTYRSINGFKTTTSSLSAQYKTAVLQGRRIYIGNVKQGGTHYPDRILKSEVNKFDTFPSDSGFIDVAVRDGESIIKLEAYADRILQFKQESLYIINVAENIEFLEDTFHNKGVLQPHHVCKTDVGIAWFNKHGVYLYDGQKVNELLAKEGLKLINEVTWEAFVTHSAADPSGGNAMISYIPKSKELIFKNNNNDIYLFDLTLRAWTSGDSKISVTTAMTNFSLNDDEELTWIDNTDCTIKTWDSSPSTSTNFAYQTMDIDFGKPAVRKKIYKVYVTYKTATAATNVQVKYDVNGAGTFGLEFRDGDNFASDLLDTTTSNYWHQATLKPDVSSEANNIYSFALKFSASGTVPASFEINDITIIYRMKSAR